MAAAAAVHRVAAEMDALFAACIKRVRALANSTDATLPSTALISACSAVACVRVWVAAGASAFDSVLRADALSIAAESAAT
jgi:hypothetical protein